MKNKISFKLKILEEYTPQEVAQFDQMHKVLFAYNASIGTKNEFPLPDYTDAEMSEYSACRELWIAKECGV